jgi:excinuclease UvrABC nuclease subunit
MARVGDLIAEQSELRNHTQEFRLWPRQWNTIADLSHFAWTSVTFNAANATSIPTGKGIYSFLINPTHGMNPHRFLGYVGKAEKGLRARYREYLTEAEKFTGRPKVVRMLNVWRGYLDFSYIELDDSTDFAALESRFNDAFLPPFNSEFSTHLNRIVNAF